MDIYRLTPTGEMLAHNPRPEYGSIRWKIISYLNKAGAKSKDDIMKNTGASSYDLAVLTGHNVIKKNDGVMV